jgi:hypothetical protein
MAQIASIYRHSTLNEHRLIETLLPRDQMKDPHLRHQSPIDSPAASIHYHHPARLNTLDPASPKPIKHTNMDREAPEETFLRRNLDEAASTAE